MGAGCKPTYNWGVTTLYGGKPHGIPSIYIHLPPISAELGDDLLLG